MMRDWNGFGWWWFVVAPLCMLLFWGVVAWVIVTFVRADSSAGPATSSIDAQGILDARYARGEIAADEYRRRTDDLRATSTRTP